VPAVVNFYFYEFLVTLSTDKVRPAPEIQSAITNCKIKII